MKEKVESTKDKEEIEVSRLLAVSLASRVSSCLMTQQE
jgi:hypothetical protein